MTMKFELISMPWRGGELHGLRATQGKGNGLAVHVHGTWGNFYGNPFIVPTGQLYTEFGFNYLTANFPGHDEAAIDEQFDDSVEALDQWIDVTSPDAPVILQGHSLGALKVLRYLAHESAKHKDSVKAVVLLAPFDVVAFYAGGGDGQVDEHLSRVDKLATERGERSLAPPEVFNLWLISLGTLRALSTPGSPADQFNSRRGLRNSPLTQMRVPTFLAIGAEDFAAFPNPREAIEMAQGLPNVYGVLVDGAPHNFAGRTEILIDRMRGWAKENLLND